MSNKVYQLVTDRIIEALDNGVVPWSKPWTGGHCLPYNMVSMDPDNGRYYQGVNVPLLWMSGYSDPRWMTFSQAKSKGYKIKKGAKSSVVTFWKFIEKADDNGKITERIPLLRYFRVYNAEQCEGVPELPQVEGVDPAVNFENCKAMLDAYGVTVKHGGPKACYQTVEDVIRMPEAGNFKDIESYWATMLHEVIHSTSHKSRLNRPIEDYAFEEMVAEIGSAFLCAQMGIERDDLTVNHASYIAGWKKILLDDPKAFMKAAKLARQAADYVLEYSGASKYAASEQEEAA